MGKQFDSAWLSDMGDQFFIMAKKVNDFRFEKRRLGLIDETTFKKLEQDSHQLMILAARLKTLSTIWVADETAEALANIQNISETMDKATDRYENIQKAILLISQIGKLGLALISMSPSEIGKEVDEFNGLLSQPN